MFTFIAPLESLEQKRLSLISLTSLTWVVCAVLFLKITFESSIIFNSPLELPIEISN